MRTDGLRVDGREAIIFHRDEIAVDPEDRLVAHLENASRKRRPSRPPRAAYPESECPNTPPRLVMPSWAFTASLTGRWIPNSRGVEEIDGGVSRPALTGTQRTHTNA